MIYGTGEPLRGGRLMTKNVMELMLRGAFGRRIDLPESHSTTPVFVENKELLSLLWEVSLALKVR